MNYTVNSCDGDENENRDTPQQQIIEMGSTVVKNKRGTIHCLTIIGQIEGHTTLPSNVRPPNMNMFCRCWRRWRRRTMWTACCCC